MTVIWQLYNGYITVITGMLYTVYILLYNITIQYIYIYCYITVYITVIWQLHNVILTVIYSITVI